MLTRPFTHTFTPFTVPKVHPSRPSFKPYLSPSSNNTPPTPDEKSLLFSLLRAIPDWADRVKERGMQRNRQLYDHAKWVDHRSSLRHVRHLLSSLSSRVILSLVPPVLTFTSVAAFVAAYNTAVILGLLPEFFPLLRASSLPYQLTAPALALLLVFRTEASYARYEEGRKAWMKVIAGTNDLARGVMALGADEGIRNEILGYVIAFPVALKCHITYGSDIGQDLQHILNVDDLAVVLKSKHRPHCIIEFISQSLRLLKFETSSDRTMLESKMSCFHEGISVCEHLMGIPIPLSYTRLTSRFLVLWHLTLPIILWDDCHWIVIPATFVSAASLFCIEEVGVLIEEPFPMLALDELCKLVQKNIKEAISTEKAVQAQLVKNRNTCTHDHSSNGRPNS